MIYGSVCSGIEAASVAWEPLGWEPRWFCEIDPFCCSVLKHHWPRVPNHGDFSALDPQIVGTVNILVGGTPCQSFSINGTRKGLEDDRGDLALRFVELARVVGARWIVWENVPGILSVDGGQAFGRFLRRLGERGYVYGYRVMDCQHFGIPQRRRRIFVVGHLGKAFRKVYGVLFDGKQRSQNSLPSTQAKQETSTRINGSRRPIWGWTGDTTPKFGREISPTFRAQQGGEGVGWTDGERWARFTPIEMERLMGLPDNHTLVMHKDKPASPAMRSRVLGNSFPVPILHWIGQGIALVD